MALDLNKYKLAQPPLDLNKYKTAPVAPTAVAQPTDTNASYSTFASSNDSPLAGTAKLVGNIPSSAFNFAKNTVNFFNPLNTAKVAQNIGTELGGALNEGDSAKQLAIDTAKGLPQAAYQTLVPQFIQHIVSGDYTKAGDTLRNDPVGQLAPLILLGRQAAQAAGQGAAFDAAMSKTAKPITGPANYLTAKAAQATGALGSQLLGASTGAGASGIKAAFNGGQAFTDAMRGKVDPETLVQTAQDAVSQIAENRRSAYQDQLAEIGKNTKSLDISPIQNTLHTQLGRFGVNLAPDGSLDFSRSSIANNGTARADVQGVYDTLKDWGTKQGDRTPLGLDILKKQLSDFYSPSGSARALVQAVKSNVTDILKQQVPGYSDMTANYAKASSLLDDIKSATAIGGKAKVDTIFSKLTNAVKQDNELRLEVLREVQAQGAQPDLMSQIAGSNMQTMVPKGLRGIGDAGVVFGVLTHFFTPQLALGLISTSPRIVGEFVRALGMGAEKTSTILHIINNLPQKGGLAPVQDYLKKNPPSIGLSIKPVGTSGNIPNGAKTSATSNTASSKRGAKQWPTTASKQSTIGVTSTGNARIGKEGVSAPKADTSGPFDGRETLTVYHASKDGKPRYIRSGFSTSPDYGFAETYADSSGKVHEYKLSPDAKILDMRLEYNALTGTNNQERVAFLKSFIKPSEKPYLNAEDIAYYRKKGWSEERIADMNVKGDPAYQTSRYIDENPGLTLDKIDTVKQTLIKHAKENGYDAVRFDSTNLFGKGSGDEILILNPKKLLNRVKSKQK